MTPPRGASRARVILAGIFTALVLCLLTLSETGHHPTRWTLISSPQRSMVEENTLSSSSSLGRRRRLLPVGQGKPKASPWWASEHKEVNRRGPVPSIVNPAQRPATKSTNAQHEAETMDGGPVTNPKWRTDYIKNLTRGGKYAHGQWKAWLKEPGWAHGSDSAEQLGIEATDVPHECGGMPTRWQKKQMPPSPILSAKLPPFFIYDGPAFDYSKLLPCYKAKYGVDAWEDERLWELAQNTGALWIHEALKSHRSRVKNPELAQLFIVPIDPYVSFKTGDCDGEEHVDRMARAAKALQHSHWFNRQKGRDHVFVAVWWGAKKAWGRDLWKLGKDHSILVTFDEVFANDWKKAVLAPYVPHALLTQAGQGYCDTRRQLLAKLGVHTNFSRSIGLYFRGSVMHGINCKFGNTWVRKAAYAAMERMSNAEFIATESSAIADHGKVNIPDEEQVDSTRLITQENQGRFSSTRYAAELLQSTYCLHFRGDTTTSRRIFDSIAAGCVPVIVSDGTNVPFVGTLDWKSFSVSIPETAILSATTDKVVQMFQKLISDKKMLKQKQEALQRVREDLIFGIGSPLVQNDALFKSTVVDHVLAECEKAMKHTGEYRRFKPLQDTCKTKEVANKKGAAGKTTTNSSES